MRETNFTLHSSYEGLLSPNDEETIPQLLLRHADIHAKNGKTARITDTISGESFDFESFDKITRNIASALYKRGFRYGDTAIYMTYDLVKLYLFFCGVWRSNGVVRACYPEDDEESILIRVVESQVGWIYCEPELADLCLSVANKIYWDVEVIVAGYNEGCTSIYDLMNDDGSEMPSLICKPEDPAFILGTSGTTGLSKGAVITHQAFIYEILSLQHGVLDKEFPNLAITKGTHTSGCVISAMGIVQGVHLLVMKTIRPDIVFEAISKYQPRHIFAFPSLLVALVVHPSSKNYDFSSLQWATTGGAPMTFAMEKIVLELPSMKNIYNHYGLTEVGPVISTLDLNSIKKPENCKLSGKVVPIKWKSKANFIGIFPDTPTNSIGKLVPGVSAQFVDVETEEVLGPNQTGELCIKCKGMFSEYLNNPKATEDSMINGYFKTGDVGYYDENGFIFLVDRAKEIFKYIGNHISPTEIENIINDHPAVAEVCVIGVPDPEGGGHLPRAFCVMLQNSKCTPQEVLEFANNLLPDFKHLRGGVFFIKQLPKGKTGKVARQLVQQIKV